MGGSSDALSMDNSIYNGLRIQSSCCGMTLPVIYGTTRISGNLIYAGNFNNVQTQSSSSGGKGGGGGPTTTTTNYFCNFMMGLSLGPISGIGQVWINKSIYLNPTLLGLTVYNGTLTQTSWNSSPDSVAYPGLSYVCCVNYPLGTSNSLPNFSFEIKGLKILGNTMTMNDEASIIPTSSPFTINAANYSTFISDISVINSITKIPLNKVGSASLITSSGEYSVLDGVYTFYFQDAGNNIYLNYTFKNQDANPADIIKDILQNDVYGVYDSLPVDSTNYNNYCLANGFFLSPAFIDQQNASEQIQNILDSSNSTCIWHNSDILLIVPYGDTDVTGNGITWTPNITPIYDLNDDDYIGDNSQDPIVVNRKSPAQANNDVKVEYLDRSNSYNTSIIESMDQGAIDKYVKRCNITPTLHGICQSSIASNISQLTEQRSLYIRNTYDFKVSSFKYGHLEPMDIITLTDIGIGLNKYPIRITQILDDGAGILSITAECFPEGVGHTTSYSRQTGLGYSSNYQVDPGNVNNPIIFNAPGCLTDSGYEIWAALSGGPNWGGCDIYVSSDNITYTWQSRKFGPSRYGILSHNFNKGTDPDTINVCSVDLTVSNGELLSGTQSAADQLLTLCLVDKELISYESSTLTSSYNYNLGTYLRRGVYGSTITDHLANENFVRLDSQISKIPFNINLAGQTMYIKFVSFNQYLLANQELADVDTYTYLIGSGLSFPDTVTGFTASQSGDFVAFTWNDLDDPAIVGYEIRYTPLTYNGWNLGKTITRSTRATHQVNFRVPPGNYTFYICAIDKSGNYSKIPTTTQLNVLNINTPVIKAIDEASTGWLGSKINMAVHCSGSLYPLSQGTANEDGDDTFNILCPQPFDEYSYTSQYLNLATNQNVRIVAILNSTLGWGEEGIPNPNLKIQYLINGIYSGWINWDIGYVYCSNVQMQFSIDPNVGMCWISSFIPTLDQIGINGGNAN
jgi:hypothetical protein